MRIRFVISTHFIYSYKKRTFVKKIDFEQQKVLQLFLVNNYKCKNFYGEKNNFFSTENKLGVFEKNCEKLFNLEFASSGKIFSRFCKMLDQCQYVI